MNCKKNVPSISVIVPIYNASKWLDRCICSILAQTFTDFELILVDDGSTDDSGNICDKFAEDDPRIRVIHKQNGGVSSARNTGIDISIGENIIFVDADDDMPTNAFDAFTGYEEDMVIGGLIAVRDGIPTNVCPITNRVVTPTGYTQLIEEYHWSLLSAVYAKIYSRKMIINNKIRFDEHIHWGEDRLFILQALNHCHSVRLIPNITYTYFLPTEGKKYRFSLNDYYYSVEAIENTIKKTGDCPKALAANRNNYYSIFLGILSIPSKSKLRTLKKIIENKSWHWFPQKRKLKCIIEVFRTILFG